MNLEYKRNRRFPIKSKRKKACKGFCSNQLKLKEKRSNLFTERDSRNEQIIRLKQNRPIEIEVSFQIFQKYTHESMCSDYGQNNKASAVVEYI